MSKFFCPDCNMDLPTVCSCCMICLECRKVFTKDHVQKYMEDKLTRLKREKEFGIIG